MDPAERSRILTAVQKAEDGGATAVAMDAILSARVGKTRAELIAKAAAEEAEREAFKGKWNKDNVDAALTALDNL